MEELLHSVKSIFDKEEGLLPSLNKTSYHIPLYQRGYKWTDKQVEKLLDDINNFSGETGKFYCVQNITLVPKKDYLSVVDGQQRLTTMTLILSALQEKDLVKDKLKFPENTIREKTNKFLNDFILDSHNVKDLEWEDFVSSEPDFDHQDIFYIHNAYRTIYKWLKENLTIEEIEKFKSKLLYDVKFIINYIEGNQEEKIFSNLNSKRIYLDGSDLVRAILITRVTIEESKKESDIKNIVRVNERRVRIGWEIDNINYWWSLSEIKKYFNPWMKLPVKGDVDFNYTTHPINMLLNLFLESEGHSELSLEVIESYSSAIHLYKKITKLNSTLIDWYDDKEIYHYLGFLFAQKRNNKDFNFKKIWDYWTNEAKTRSNFKKYLLGLIKQEIFGENTINQIFAKEKNWYEGDEKTLVQILLLLDIIEANKPYKDKLKNDAFFKSGNDIEHIFPQNPKGKDLNEKSDFIKFLLKYDNTLENEDLLTNFEQEKENEEYLEDLDKFLDEYTSKYNVHSIGNLVLLDASLNRSISNNPYAYKRKRVLNYFNEGNFINPHTLKVFARYFQDENSSGVDAEYWTKEDIDANENNIKSNLLNFFKGKLEDGQE